MYLSSRPYAPLWVRTLFPLIHCMELVCIAFGFQAITGYPAWYGAALGLTVMCLFELTVFSAVLLPLTLLGAHFLTGLPWTVTLPVFALPYIYNFFFMRRFYRMEAVRKLLQRPNAAARYHA